MAITHWILTWLMQSTRAKATNLPNRQLKEILNVFDL